MTLLSRIIALILSAMLLNAESTPINFSSSQAEIEIMRVDGMNHSIAFIFRNADSIDPARLRIYFNTDANDPRESNSRASLMLEGTSFYEYPQGAEGWNWDRMDAALMMKSGDTQLMIVSHPRFEKDFSYFVELTGSDWSVTDRWPNVGTQSVKVRDLPTCQLPADNAEVDIQPLLDARPESLSIQLNHGPDLTNWESTGKQPNFTIANELFKSIGIDEAQLLFTIHDAATGENASAIASEVWKNGNGYAWKGSTLGVDWSLLIEAKATGEIEVLGWLYSEDERFIRTEVGFERSLKKFTWSDDISSSREIHSTEDQFGNFATSRYGSERKQSYYPFAVVDNKESAFVIETDPTEPRVFYLEADSNSLTANYEMALTSKTVNFPKQATFRCSIYQLPLSGHPGFRTALNSFNTRHPRFNERRVPRSGLWMPFTDISTLKNPEDFGFTFFEKGGIRGSDVEFAEDNDILTLMYTEPWLYWLPFNEGESRTPEKALEKMRQIASTGTGWSRDLAASGLAGATQNANGSVAMKFMDLPWNNGARMEVNTAPDLESIAPFKMNRAEAEWKQIIEFLSDPRVDGIYLDSMDAAVLPDYSLRALAATNYPATFSIDRLQPQIPPMLPQYEFTSALGSYLHSKGKFLMGNFSIVDAPFVNQWIDIPGQETDWFSGGRYHAPTRAQLNYRRAMSGQKPFGFLQSTDFSEFKGTLLQRYFETCLLYGFQPSFFSHNAADNPYWLNHPVMERDRHLFKTFVPHIQRLSDSGWQAVRNFESTQSANIQTEQFGEPTDGIWHIVIQNLSENIETVELKLPKSAEDTLLLQPLYGHMQWMPEDGAVKLSLLGNQTIMFDIVPARLINDELDFMKNWKSGLKEAKMIVAVLESAVREKSLDISLNARLKANPIIGEPAKWVLTLLNSGEQTLDWHIDDQVKTLGPNETESVQISLPDRNEAQLISGSIEMKNGDSFVFARSLKAEAISPIKVIDFEPRFMTRDSKAKLPLKVENVTDTMRTYSIAWKTEHTTDEKTIELAPGAIEAIALSIPNSSNNTENMTITIASKGRALWESGCLIVYLGENVSLAMDSAVKIKTDSTFGGYSTTALNDGIMSTDDVAWNQGSWASADSEAEHWIELKLPKPTKLQKVDIHWNREGGITYTGQNGRVIAQNAEGETMELGNWHAASGDDITTISFDQQPLTQIRVIQNAQGGSKERPGIMWVSEVSVY